MVSTTASDGRGVNSASNDLDRSELFFGLVGPAGVRLNDLSAAIAQELSNFGYTTKEIRLSELLENFRDWCPAPGPTEFQRIIHLQEMGNGFRRATHDAAALARASIAAIREGRASGIGKDPDRPGPGNAYILNQLKRPEEVDLLRQIYGSSFHLIAGHAPKNVRAMELARRNARKLNKVGQEDDFLAQAHEVIQKDQKQEDDFGQNTRDTYPKADFFTNLGIEQGEQQVRRYVQLLFGHPLRVPTAAEYAMYQASAVSLRSSDISRQVGAAIVNLRKDPKDTAKVTNAELIAVGMNEVPRGGGASYYDDYSPDARDQALLLKGEDRATEFKASALSELIQRLKDMGLITDARLPHELARETLPALSGTQFMAMGEFSRPVHAEMAALIDAARRGVSVDGHSMFVTTFPCHNCAKHIIAAGLRTVIYLEPYPKSRAENLYREEIDLEGIEEVPVPGKLVFRSFSGVAPRQYGRLFSMSERGKKSGKTLREWEAQRSTLSPLYVSRNASGSYLISERDELRKLLPEMYRWNQRLADDLRSSGTASPATPT